MATALPLSELISEVLRECCLELKDNLDPSPMMSYLHKHICITTCEKELVESQGARHHKVSKLLDILSTKDDIALDHMLQCLWNDGTQMQLYTLLKSTAEKRGYKWQLQLDEMKNIKSNQVLREKWWPESKPLIHSFLHRFGTDGKLLIEAIHEQLQSSQNRQLAIVPQTQTLVGMGGVGKTTTAKWYANKYEDIYDHVIWIDSEGPSLENSITRLADTLQIAVTTQNGIKKNTEELSKEGYLKLAGCECLFIFDNVDEYACVRKLLPNAKAHHVLITSRVQFNWGNPAEFGSIPTFPIRVFNEDECIQLFENAFKLAVPAVNLPTHEEIRELGHVLGFLPLALQCAIATLTSPRSRFTFASYMQRLKTDMKIIMGKKHLDEYTIPISAALQLSLEQMQSQIPESDHALRNIVVNVAARCDPDYIKEEMFLALPNVEQYEVEDAMDDLLKYSILTLDNKSQAVHTGDHDHRQFRMHRLLQQVVRDTLAQDSDRECEMWRFALMCLRRIRSVERPHPAMVLWRKGARKYEKILIEFNQYGLELMSGSLHDPASLECIQFTISNLARLYGQNDARVVQHRIELSYIFLQKFDWKSSDGLLQQIHEHLHSATAPAQFHQEIVAHLKLARMYYYRYGVRMDRNLDNKNFSFLEVSLELYKQVRNEQFNDKIGEYKIRHRVELLRESAGVSYIQVLLAATVNYVCALVEEKQVTQAIDVLLAYFDNKIRNSEVMSSAYFSSLAEILRGLANSKCSHQDIVRCYTLIKSLGILQQWMKADNISDGIGSFLARYFETLLSTNDFDQLFNEVMDLFKMEGHLANKLFMINDFMDKVWDSIKMKEPNMESPPIVVKMLELIWNFSLSQSFADIHRDECLDLHLHTLFHVGDVYIFSLLNSGKESTVSTAMQVESDLVQLMSQYTLEQMKKPAERNLYEHSYRHGRFKTQEIIDTLDHANSVLTSEMKELLKCRLRTIEMLWNLNLNGSWWLGDKKIFAEWILCLAYSGETDLIPSLLSSNWARLMPYESSIINILEPVFRLLHKRNNHNLILSISQSTLERINTNSFYYRSNIVFIIKTLCNVESESCWIKAEILLKSHCTEFQPWKLQEILEFLPEDEIFVGVRTQIQNKLQENDIWISLYKRKFT